MYVVIMAGGGGTRLWPLSTPERPKPFLPLLGERTLLQRTVDRLAGPELDMRPRDVAVVTDRRYTALVHEQLPGVTVVEEPIGRNTAAAIALATVAIERPDDEVMVVLPADQTIAPDLEGVFRATLAAAERGLARGAFGVESPLVTLGVQVDRPATEYGYLIPRLEARETLHGLAAYPLEAYPLVRFEEKPTSERAEQLRHQAGVAWNAGMFLWRRRAIRSALGAFAPEVLEPVADGYRSGRLEDVYPELRSASIDYAVMEPAARAGLVVMGAMSVGWSDLGSWTALLAALGGEGFGRVAKNGEEVDVDEQDLIVQRFDRRLVVTAVAGPGSMAAYEPIAVLRGARASEGLVEDLLERCSDPEG